MKSDLNLIQSKIVNTIKGPIMVISGAGSGKTRVIIHRIIYLIKQGINPFNILSLTFTNKAAREMKQRIEHLLNSIEIKNIWMGTFHSIFARILRFEAFRLGYPSNYTIYDQKDSENIIKNIVKKLNLKKELYNPKILLSRISKFKNNLITVNSYFKNSEFYNYDIENFRPRMGDIYRSYINQCFKSGAMDFDDILLHTNKILVKFPEILYKYQNIFKYIMVDEYQDTNHLQYLILKILASRYKNICVVGDDAQSIYSFRGANIHNILNFKLDYPNAKIFRLEQNYRSTNYIVESANDVILYNKNQLEKKNWTQNNNGEKIKVYRASSEREESNFIANTIYNFTINYKFCNKDFAILYRTNVQSRSIEESFRKKNIPYQIYGGISFYQRKEIKDLLAYLRFLVNPKDEEALLRIINYPPRGIGKTTINKLILIASKSKKTIYELLENPELIFSNKLILKKLKNFFLMIKYFILKIPKGVYYLVKEILKKSGFLENIRKDHTPEGALRYENIQEFINSIQVYVKEQSKLIDGNISLISFLEYITFVTDISDNKEKNFVSLMTIHLSKGLEFPIVFIIGLEENLFPSILSLNTYSNLEEERRLFYVALTRAQKQIILSYSLTRYRWGKIINSYPSRFINEINQNRLIKLNF